MEIWDLYTEAKERTGRTMVRGEQVPEGLFHLVVHVWIRNSAGKYLISQRSASRKRNPLKFESVGGAVLKGETSLEAALRETEEEVGVKLSPKDGRLLFSEVRHPLHDIFDVWLFSYDGEADLKNATTDEVAQTAWMTRGQIAQLFDAGNFAETLRYFFDRVDVQ